jgi:hypothetical protein
MRVRDVLSRRVDELLAQGVTLRDACARVALEEGITDRRGVSAAAYVERQWANAGGPPAPSQVRAGRREKRFI